MSRRTVTKKRPVPADPVHNSRLVSMTIRRVMRSGKKSLASGIVYDALKTVGERTGNDPMETFEKAIRNLTPLVEVKARRYNILALEADVPWQVNWQTKLWTQLTRLVQLLRKEKKPTKWQMQIKHSLTIDIKVQASI
jgi:small subunit ribosomal protein S7